MKSYLFPIIFIASSLIMVSCSKDDDDDDDSDNEPNQEIYGEWNMVNFTTYSPESPQNFDHGDVVWTFDTDGLVDVNVNVVLDDDSHIPLDSTGTYNYSLNQNDNIVVLQDDEAELEYDYHFEGENLIISNDPELDGPRIEFER